MPDTVVTDARTDIVVTDEAGLRRIRMDRPAKRNALTAGMYRAMQAALEEAATRPAIGALLIEGAPGCFTAGNDLGDFRDRQAQGLDPTAPAMGLLRALAGFPKPVVAAVGGLAIGIGTTLLLHCDLAYAAEDATFRLPFVDLGLCPEAASSALLPLRAGPALANELLLLGEAFDAATALRAGLVNEVLPASGLAARAEARARAFLARPPGALAATKALIRSHRQALTEQAMAAEAARLNALLAGPEAAEALAAFAARRPPDFARFRQETV
jgi:enoyl-CoA hydratase/carnithine racemase